MTFEQLTKQYLQTSQSTSKTDRWISNGLLQVINAYNSDKLSNEYYDEVHISIIAENLSANVDWLYKTTKQEQYKWINKGIRSCIINYISDKELSTLIAKYRGNLTELALFEYIDKTPYKNHVKYSSIHSLCEVMKLSLK